MRKSTDCAEHCTVDEGGTSARWSSSIAYRAIALRIIDDVTDHVLAILEDKLDSGEWRISVNFTVSATDRIEKRAGKVPDVHILTRLNLVYLCVPLLLYRL